MLIVAERINASRKPVRAALEKFDAAAVQAEAKIQAAAGAHYIDVNGGTFPGREPELLTWLVEVVQDVTELPLSVDSSDPAALAAALPKTKRAPMINSVTLEGDRFERVLALAREHKAKLVALCQGEGPMASTVERKLELGCRLVDRLTDGGMALDDIYVDPLVFPVATDPASATATLHAFAELMRRYPGVHTICGLTNVSHGLPARKLVNRTFLVASIAFGLDAVIADPTNAELMAAMVAAEALSGRDEYCVDMIQAFQDGKLG
ncbi:MAG TPA: dihydropteroate synthase [Hyphomicrobiaceae bacterium]|nr:dihydropteroate synthase [Hyphomicrobiaceae bacterium]